MKKMMIFFLILTVGVMASCSEKSKNKPIKENKTIDATLELNRNEFSITAWELDNSHMETVKGKILVGDEPVENVLVKVSEKRNVHTNKNGEFRLMVSRNILEKKSIHVVNADKAKIDGKFVDNQIKDSLLTLEKSISVHYPIEIDQVIENEKDKKLVDVHATVVLKEGQEYPAFGVIKYKISGTIKDADGKPAVGATVNFRRDGVEGFTMSDPSNDNGEYVIYYIPEDEENHYMNVLYKGKTYTLPENKAYLFPEDIGVNINITLPKEGTVIEDKPPTLVSTTDSGALYTGTLIGVNLDKDVKYFINIPNRDGTFVLTLPKSEWDKNPTFFQTKFMDFLEEGKKSGDVIPSEFIPKVKKNEPNQIVANK
ncbi:carboxypeptidase-like regulatory domain-containing protein [Metabacillus sediminilitoris]|uniref:Carboxypeptidase regulatory-like domain-containing protein n=1 Tax=Metabacillus sediminilitoris TaxID=2567941 RepID=A0A4S4BWW3_9BACI|nr:carboxypeptidase-like regulatory domain-containing protein [Metabacillus sediminilitoris]QGQ45967.1 hypothetical protein GMB29_12450 [Metabacillus sediminilitoris]THF79651.1 hypothetical protein E6W99_11570 [Metabacillus sediminilitoris]